MGLLVPRRDGQQGQTLSCCTLEAQLWPASEARGDVPGRGAVTHIFLQAYLLPPVEVDIQMHTEPGAGGRVTALGLWWVKPGCFCYIIGNWFTLLKFISWDSYCCQSYLCFASWFDWKAWQRREKERGEIRSQRAQIFVGRKSLQLAIIIRLF